MLIEHQFSFSVLSTLYSLAKYPSSWFNDQLTSSSVSLYLDLNILSLSPSRKLRVRDPSKFHVQLCIALFCMLLFFLVGINRTENEVACTMMSVLIQYFTFASVLWMGAEAVLMFQKLIIVFGQITTKYMLVVSLICWCKCSLSFGLWIWSLS